MLSDDVVQVLTDDECRELLAGETLGRLATTAGGQVDIVPINYYSDGRSILIRTAPGTKLLELTVHDQVAFEVDDHSDVEAWSVVVHGRARELESQTEIAAADRTPLRPWIPTLKYRYVRIEPERLTGRRFPIRPEPDRY